MQIRIKQILRTDRKKGKPYLLIGVEGKMTTCVLQMREEKYHEDWREVEIVLAYESPLENGVGEEVDKEVAMYGMPGGLSDSFSHPKNRVTMTGRKGIWPRAKADALGLTPKVEKWPK